MLLRRFYVQTNEKGTIEATDCEKDLLADDLKHRSLKGKLLVSSKQKYCRFL